jgi:hypothetical protein
MGRGCNHLISGWGIFSQSFAQEQGWALMSSSEMSDGDKNKDDSKKCNDDKNKDDNRKYVAMNGRI